MSKISGLLGLPELGLNALCVSVAAIGIGIAFRIGVSPNLDLKWANNQLITSTSVDQLENIANQLEEKVEIIQEKDQAYEQLKVTYDNYLTTETGGINLDEAFNAIKELPKVDDTEELLTEIEEIEENLLEVTTEPN